MELDIRWCIVFGCVGIIIGFILGRIRPKNLSFGVFLKKIYRDLDNLILLISGLMLIGSVCFATFGKLEAFASTVINMFSSIVFSWLLTKKSSKVEFKQQEEELALRSYRYINNIETTANTANARIEKYIKEHPEIGEKEKLVLDGVIAQIKYIQTGINTCKRDWHDMLSDEQKEHYVCDTEYGGMTVVMEGSEYNQEDA